jgi:hypothetical protein
MKMCQKHWDMLRAAISSRGLDQFIAPDGEAATARALQQMKNAAEGEKAITIATFDPLMDANYAIWSNALRMGGNYMLGADEKGEHYCPVCEAVTHKSHDEDWWITNAADEQLNKAKELGVIPTSVN